MAIKIGFVTIGQSPRDDIVPEIAEILGPDIEIFERGALDGLMKAEIERLQPEKGHFPLITRLKDGSAAMLEKKKVAPLLRKQIKQLADLDLRLIALLCTEDFHRLEPQASLLQPSKLLFHSVVSFSEKGKLGVFVPLEEQIEGAKRKWKKTRMQIIVEALNPYLKSPEYDRALKKMRTKKPDLVVLDCIGYSKEIKERIRLLLETPALLPRSVLARAILEFI
jgi:protein AroM